MNFFLPLKVGTASILQAVLSRGREDKELQLDSVADQWKDAYLSIELCCSSENIPICVTICAFFMQDYWLSLLYKQLVGPRVLAVHVAGLQRKPRPGRVIRDKLRIYAHCTSYHK